MSVAEILTLLKEIGELLGLGDRLLCVACQLRPELRDALSAAKRLELDMRAADERIDAELRRRGGA